MDGAISFFTASIVEWKKLLERDNFKEIIIESLRFLVREKRIFLYGFVIMPNHIHLLWSIRENHELKNVQRDFLKFTAQQFKFNLSDTSSEELIFIKKSKSDREYQFWQRNSYNVEMESRKILEQKLDYMHDNPLQEKWQLVDVPEDYFYSSARYYNLNLDDWKFITHYMEHI